MPMKTTLRFYNRLFTRIRILSFVVLGEKLFFYSRLLFTKAVFPNGPISSDFGPKSDLFGQKGQKMVRFYNQKSDCDKNEEK